MKRFIIFKNNNNINDIIDVFKTLVGQNIEIEYSSNVIVRYNYENQNDVKELLISFCNENMVDLICYVSSLQEAVINAEINIGLNLIDKLPSGVYDLKNALLNVKSCGNCKMILNAILSSSGVDEEFIKQFLSYDLNISRASKNMYIHRNTLNYKIDKLYELSGFDLRVFLDSYILYNLIQNR